MRVSGQANFTPEEDYMGRKVGLNPVEKGKGPLSPTEILTRASRQRSHYIRWAILALIAIIHREGLPWEAYKGSPNKETQNILWNLERWSPSSSSVVQPVASRYTDYAIPAPNVWMYGT
jgi:hypothetical protein